MKRVDLHVHSCHSRHASEWILQRLGAQESYADVEGVYRRAKSRGADYVTLTDHNTIEGALELVSRHPADCFISTEATAYFPEDGCKVHVLCYGITPAQFVVIQQVRENIYALRDYLRREEIACSVAHAMYSVNGRLTVSHLEKLLLLFNVFEGINGTRPREGHGSWQELLRRLTPDIIAELADRHQLEPWGAESWIKGITGGSDDHAGLFIGETYTLARATDIAGFLHALRAKRTLPGGRYGDPRAAFLPAQDWAGLLDDLMGPVVSTGKVAHLGKRATWPHRLYGAGVPAAAAPAGHSEGASRAKARNGARKNPDLRVWAEPMAPASYKSDARLVNS